MSKKFLYFSNVYTQKLLRNKNQKPKFVIFEEKNFRQKISDLIKIKSKKESKTSVRKKYFKIIP